MTKIPLKPKKIPKYHRNLKSNQNTPETQKMTEMPPNLKMKKEKPHSYQRILNSFSFQFKFKCFLTQNQQQIKRKSLEKWINSVLNYFHLYRSKVYMKSFFLEEVVHQLEHLIVLISVLDMSCSIYGTFIRKKVFKYWQSDTISNYQAKMNSL